MAGLAAGDEGSQRALGQAGACEWLGRLLTSAAEEDRTQLLKTAFHTTAVLTFRHADNTQRVVAGRGGEVAVRVLHSQGQEAGAEGVVAQACGLLSNLARRDCVLQEELGRQGACEAVAEALRAHPHARDVQVYGAVAAGWLAGVEANRLRLLDCGACALACRAARASLSDGLGGVGRGPQLAAVVHPSELEQRL
jgi:hypothetical protein